MYLGRYAFIRPPHSSPLPLSSPLSVYFSEMLQNMSMYKKIVLKPKVDALRPWLANIAK